MRWNNVASICSILFLLGLFACSCEEEDLHRIEYGPVVAVEARLSDNVIRAGGRTTVTCILQAEPGFQVQHPETYRTYVEPLEGLSVEGVTIGGISPGEYEVRCGIEEITVEYAQIPDHLTVETEDPYRLGLYVDPDQAFYRVGDDVTLTAHVYDIHDNIIERAAEDLEWDVPAAGLTDHEEGTGLYSFSFEDDGIYEVSVALGEPYDIASEVRVLICDSEPPLLELTSPDRGESLDGDVITVTGTARDEVSGLASLTVNGIDVDVEQDGSFSIDLDPAHGLNHIAALAMDEAGHRAEAFTSVYHSPVWLPLEEDSADAKVPGGLGVHLSQEVIDSGHRDCGWDDGGLYLCEEYEDMATMVEVVLNNIDLSEIAAGTLYEYGPYELFEQNLGSTRINIPAVSPILNDRHRIHGSFVLRGDYTISVNTLSVEIGRAEMGDPGQGQLGLRSVDGGLDLVAYLRPDGDQDAGLTVHLEIRIDVEVSLFFTLDKSYHEDNGVWNRDKDPEEDVTADACGSTGVLQRIDTALDLLAGWDTNFRGYICREEPLAFADPSVFTGAKAKFDQVRISGRLVFETTDDGRVRVRLQAHDHQPLLDFLGQGIEIESDDDIIIDLSEVEFFDGYITIDLGEVSIGNPAGLLDPILSELLTLLQVLVADALEDLIVCEDASADDCPLSIDSLLEEIFNSLAQKDQSVLWPAVMPGGEDMSVVISQYFSAVNFSHIGGRIGYASSMQTTRDLHPNIPEPRGVLLRGDCAGSGTLAALPTDRRMAAGFDLDLVNHALLVGWYNGGLSGEIEPDDLEGIIDSLWMEIRPLLPPIMTACTGDPEQLELQLGAAQLLLSMRIAGSQVEATVYSDLAFKVEPDEDTGRLHLMVSEEPLLNELEILATLGDLETHKEDLKDLIAQELMPDLLARFGQEVLAGIPVPTINLTNAALPGLDLGMDIEIEFPVTEASHEDAVIVVISD